MYITIDFHSDVPIYQQLKDNLIIGIAAGKLKPGESLPSVRQLAAELGVNLHTINKAYNQLKSEGYITVDRRIGTTVLPTPETISEKNLDQTKADLLLVLSTAKCRGLSKEALMKLIDETLNHIEGVN